MNQLHSFVLAVLLLALLGGSDSAFAQHHGGQHQGTSEGAQAAESTVLQAPGHDVFGTVQEAIRRLEADSTTDWSEVNVQRLHRHLRDMHQVALNVAVEEQASIANGVRLRVRPEGKDADASLERVLDAHPHMLKQETGWTMAVEETGDTYVLRVTTDDADDTDKIRALGYMGLLAYGNHHQRHHWHLVKGQHPHATGGK